MALRLVQHIETYGMTQDELDVLAELNRRTARTCGINGTSIQPRLCKAYCNSLRAGHASGPLCPHCDHIEGLVHLFAARGL
jgi:hypothetical protein